MERRKAIKYVSLALGYSVSASLTSAVLSGCKSEPALDWKPVFLNGNQVSLASALADHILPATDTPGALDVGVPRFIDFMLYEVYPKREQHAFVTGLDEWEQYCRDQFGKQYSKLSKEEKDVVFAKYDTENFELFDNNYVADGEKPFYAILKELTLMGYFTSEIIGEQFLDYDPLPGAYKGCIPMRDDAKHHSLNRWSVYSFQDWKET